MRARAGGTVRLTAYASDMARVKICGVTRPEDAELCAELGAWAVGLNFVEQSPRFVDRAVAIELAAVLKRRCEVVGVFVNPTLAEVASAVEDLDLTMTQLHGDEGPSFCAEVARKTGTKVIKAFSVRSAAEIMAAEAFRCDYHLFDSDSGEARGGSGVSFDWTVLGKRDSTVPMILAGGIGPDNAARAIEVTHPYALDVASGVEVSPGIKDPGRLRSLFAAIGSGSEAASA